MDTKATKMKEVRTNRGTAVDKWRTTMYSMYSCASFDLRKRRKSQCNGYVYYNQFGYLVKRVWYNIHYIRQTPAVEHQDIHQYTHRGIIALLRILTNKF